MVVLIKNLKMQQSKLAKSRDDLRHFLEEVKELREVSIAAYEDLESVVETLSTLV